jgi:hypothetical protein
MNPHRVCKEVKRLKSLGVLLEGGKLDPDVERFINTVLGNKLSRIIPKKT